VNIHPHLPMILLVLSSAQTSSHDVDAIGGGADDVAENPADDSVDDPDDGKGPDSGAK
jgi:hypothetical protein